MVAEEKTRVDFNAPASLVERADTVADILDVSRTQLLIDALREEIADIAADEKFQQRLRQAFYDGRIEYDVVESILGTEEAMRMHLLQQSLDRDPPEPRLDRAIASTETFYQGGVPEWIPNGDTESDDMESRS